MVPLCEARGFMDEGHDPVGYVQGCQLSIQGMVRPVVKALSRWQTLTEI